MQSNVKTELAVRKLWVEPEFEVLNADDAAAVGPSGATDAGIYS